MNNTPQYTLLEPISGVGSSANLDSNSFANYLQNSFNLIFGVIIVLSVFRVMYGGALFLTSDVVIGKMKGKDIIVNSLRGIFLALITYSIMYWINPEMLNNKIGSILSDGGRVVGEKVKEVIGNVGVSINSGGPAARSCDSVASSIDKLKTGQNVCAGASCSKTCSFTSEIVNAIKAEATSANIDYRIVMALACRESTGNPNAVGNHANNGYPDCGLMQINMSGRGNSCSPEIMDINNNIREGIKLYKSKLTTAKSYNTVDRNSQAFASYNCCSNGENPNSQSNSCNTATGFTESIPKWACPIDPGTGSFNMCAVKSYACDVTACIAKY